MPASKSETPPQCEFCNKQGLAVLPVRYAIAGADSAAPEASLPGSESVTRIELGPAKYTTRSLRAGFLYVYDEAKDQWDGYYITPGSYLFKFDLDLPQPNFDEIRFTCSRETHGLISSCVTIEDPDNATKVWFGFSDVPWTDAVIERHQSAAEREKHMRCLDVAAWIGSHEQPHAKPVNELDGVVAEYAVDGAEAKLGFAWSAADFWRKTNLAPRLKLAANRSYPDHALVLAVDDPTAITQDLAGMMQYRLDKFIKEKKLTRGLAVSGAIQSLETAIKDQAELREIEAGDELADQAELYSGMSGTMSAFTTPTADAEGIERMRNPTQQDLDAAANNAWKKYTAKYDEKARSAWQGNADEQLKAFDADIIAPLAQAHATWMTHSITARSFECNFDENDIENGGAYTHTLNLCIAGTQDKKACFDVYHDWLQGDLTDKKNLLLRATLYNYEPSAQEIQSAASSTTDWASLPWDAVIGVWLGASEKVRGGQADVLGRFLSQINGPVAKLLTNAASSNTVHKSLVALGAVNGHGMVRVEITGSRADFKRLLMHELRALSGQPIAGKSLRRTVNLELRRLKARGYKLNDPVKMHWLILADPQHIDAMPTNLNTSGRAQWLANSLKHPDDIRQLQLSRWKLRVQQSGLVHGVGVFGLGVLGGIFQFAALAGLMESDAKALSHAKPEIKRRLAAQAGTLAGTIAEITGQSVEKLGAVKLSGKAGRVVSKFGAGLGIAGRALGVAGGLAMAVFDFWRGYQEFEEGNVVVGAGFLAMGILGAAATFAILAGAFLLAGILIVAILVLSIFMGSIADNKIQDWLERCYLWGKLEDYGDAETEMREFRVAIQG